MHPVGRLVVDALDARFPAADGGWHRVEPWRDGVEAVLAFTGHAVLAVGDDVTDERLDALGANGTGGAHHPRIALEIAGTGWIDCIDAVTAARGTGGGTPLVERPDLAEHHRAEFARAVRDDVRVLGRPNPNEQALVTLSRGIGGLYEVSFEVPVGERGRGTAASLLRAALAAVPRGEPVVAAVAPGNAASLRAVLNAGFVPIASVQLMRPKRCA